MRSTEEEEKSECECGVRVTGKAPTVNYQLSTINFILFLRTRTLPAMLHPVVYFDGVCNFCNASVNFLIRVDQKKQLRFAALQSEAGKKIMEQASLQSADTFLLAWEGQIYQRSTAALKIIPFLPWYWQWARIFWIIPRFLRDAIYDFIAANRYRWFGKRDECMVPTPEVRSRFLD